MSSQMVDNADMSSIGGDTISRYGNLKEGDRPTTPMIEADIAEEIKKDEAKKGIEADPETDHPEPKSQDVGGDDRSKPGSKELSAEGDEVDDEEEAPVIMAEVLEVIDGEGSIVEGRHPDDVSALSEVGGAEDASVTLRSATSNAGHSASHEEENAEIILPVLGDPDVVGTFEKTVPKVPEKDINEVLVISSFLNIIIITITIIIIVRFCFADLLLYYLHKVVDELVDLAMYCGFASLRLDDAPDDVNHEYSFDLDVQVPALSYV